MRLTSHLRFASTLGAAATLCFAFALAPSSARAQAPLQSFRVDDIAGVYAGNSWQSSAKNIAIGTTLELSESFKRGSQTLASARSLATKTLSGCRFRIDASTSGRGAASGTTIGSGGLPGAQRYLLSIRAGTPQTATVFVRYRGVVRGSASASASLMSNVGNHTLVPDGTTRQWSQSGLPIRSIDNAVSLSVDAQCGAASPGSVSWDIEVELRVDTRCSVSFGSTSCTAAGTLDAYVRGISNVDDVVVTLETQTPILTPPTIATLLVSPTGQTVANLPGFASPTCTMFAIPPIVVDVQAAPFGSVRHNVTVPASVRGSIFFQTLLSRALNSPEILASTGTMRVDCR